MLCGGQGTRLREITGDAVPKALIDVAGRPFIDYKLEELAAQGFREVHLLVGIRGDLIRTHVGTGERYGLSVNVIDDGPAPLGTGGAVREAAGHLSETFWVTYGDTLLNFSPADAERVFRAHDWAGLMTVLHNRGQWGASNALVVGEQVVAYAKNPVPSGAEHIDYGMVILRRLILESFPAAGSFDLADILTGLAQDEELGAYEVKNRFYEIGTPDSLREVAAYVGHDHRATESRP